MRFVFDQLLNIFYISILRKMQGALLPLTSTQYEKDSSKWSHGTLEKPTQALSTVNLSRQKQQFEKESLNSLSQIILNFEDFWLKNANYYQKQNSFQGLNLDLDSMLSQKLKSNESFNDLSVKSKTIINNDNSLHQQTKNSSDIVKMTAVTIKERKDKQKEKKIFQGLQIQSKKSLNDQSNNIRPKKQLNFLLQPSQIKQYQKAKLQHDIRQKQAAIKNIQFLKEIEEVCFVGYWCSLFLSMSQIRWEKICTLLYLQCSEQLKNHSIQDSHFVIIRQKKGQYKDMLTNINQMIERSGLKYTSLHSTKSRYTIIIKESQHFVEDIVKDQNLNKNYQFCLYKMIKGLIIVSKFNNCSVISSKLEQLEQFSIKALKKYLITYKQILKSAQNKKNKK